MAVEKRSTVRTIFDQVIHRGCFHQQQLPVVIEVVLSIEAGERKRKTLHEVREVKPTFCAICWDEWRICGPWWI